MREPEKSNAQTTNVGFPPDDRSSYKKTKKKIKKKKEGIKKKKTVFIPNRWKNTKDQRDGLEQIKSILQREGGYLLDCISDKPAAYGSFLQGNRDNFFDKIEDNKLKNIFKNLIEIIK